MRFFIKRLNEYQNNNNNLIEEHYKHVTTLVDSCFNDKYFNPRIFLDKLSLYLNMNSTTYLETGYYLNILGSFKSNHFLFLNYYEQTRYYLFISVAMSTTNITYHLLNLGIGFNLMVSEFEKLQKNVKSNQISWNSSDALLNSLPCDYKYLY